MLNEFISEFCAIKGIEFDSMDNFLLEMDSLENVVLAKSKSGVDIAISYNGMLYVTFLSFQIICGSAYVYCRPKEIQSATESLYPSVLLDYLDFVTEYRTDDMTQPTELRDYCYLSPAIINVSDTISAIIKRAVKSITEI